MSWTNVQSKVTHQTTASLTLTASLTSAPTAGNLLVSSFFMDGTVGGVLTPPVGWTSIGSAHGTSITPWICYRVAASGDPSSWTWTVGDAQLGWLEIDEWSGNTAAPLDVSSFVNTAGGSPATSLTLANAGELVYFDIISGSGATAIALPAGFTSLGHSYATSPSYQKGYEVFAASGATGTQTGTVTGATNSALAMVAFIPSSGTVYLKSASALLTLTAGTKKIVQQPSRAVLSLTATARKTINQVRSHVLILTAAAKKIVELTRSHSLGLTATAKKIIQITRAHILTLTAVAAKSFILNVRASVTLSLTASTHKLVMLHRSASLSPVARAGKLIFQHKSAVLSVVPKATKIIKLTPAFVKLTLTATGTYQKVVVSTVHIYELLVSTIQNWLGITSGIGGTVWMTSTIQNWVGMTSEIGDAVWLPSSIQPVLNLQSPLIWP